jgi:peptide deformylase
MAAREIVLMGDPVLRKEAQEVTDFDRELRTLVRDMYESMYHAEGVGLAAPQIGISKRVIVIDLRKDDEPNVRLALINPRVVWHSDARDKSAEGCLSIPGLEEVVERTSDVHVEGVDPDGLPIRVEAEDLLARALQHEIDHLDGILFVDRVSGLKRRMLMKKWKKLRAEAGS